MEGKSVVSEDISYTQHRCRKCYHESEDGDFDFKEVFITSDYEVVEHYIECPECGYTEEQFCDNCGCHDDNLSWRMANTWEVGSIYNPYEDFGVGDVKVCSDCWNGLQGD